MALPRSGNQAIGAWLTTGSHAAIMDQQQASRALAAAGRLLLSGPIPQRGSSGPHLWQHDYQSPAFHALALEAERGDKDEAPVSLHHLRLQHSIASSGFLPFAYSGLAMRQGLPLPLDISGKRHISFFRFLSGGQVPPAKRTVPDAADADAALADYIELRARLDKVQRPASIRTATQVFKDSSLAVGRGLLAVWHFLLSVPRRITDWRAMTPEDWATWKKETWATVKHEAHHYWVGTKLLGYEVRIASRHAFKAAQGKALSRRERAQLTRTSADLFRLVPMVIIIVIPFLEFFLPLLLRIFPNMLPSTFEDKLKKEEELKRRLSVRLELAKFLQDTVAMMASDIARRKGSSADAQDLNQFIQKVRAGKEVDNAEIIRFARLFNDELTLDHLERVQLVSMCQFVGISPFGTDAFLRSRLRTHLQQMKQDDFEIEQEGLENMTEDELRSACRARGIRGPYGEGAVRFMERQLRDWLDLSLHRGLPSSLLLLSRAFTITAQGPQQDVSAAKDEKYVKLKETLGVIPGQVVDSVAVEQLGSGKGGVEALQQRLEFLVREEEAIRAELQRADAAAKAAAAAEAAMRKAVTEGDTAKSAALAASAAASPPAGVQPAPDTSNLVVALEEAAAELAAAKDKRLKQIIGSLVEMATGSAVAKERGVFMDLMRKEMDRVNTVLAENRGSSTGTMTFSSKGLEVANEQALEEEGAPGSQPAARRQPAQTLPSRLSERVSRMLTSIEAELDAVESKIGGKMHVLDTDKDGKVTSHELEQALRFVRDQLSPLELSELLLKLKSVAKAAGTEHDNNAGVIEMAKLTELAGTEKEKASEAEAAPAVAQPRLGLAAPQKQAQAKA